MPSDDIAKRGREIFDAGERCAFQETCCVQRGALRQQSTNGLGDVGPLLGQPPGFCYSRLLRYRVGADVQQPSFIVTGDLAESWTPARSPRVA